jgi:hypothetical protein
MLSLDFGGNILTMVQRQSCGHAIGQWELFVLLASELTSSVYRRES